MTVKKILDLAKREIGTVENPSGSNKVKYNTEYYGKPVVGGEYPWCCVFIWWLFKRVGASDLFYDGKKTASCTTLYNKYKANWQSVSKNALKPGDLVFFNFNGGTKIQHIGIVESVSSNIVTIEGNTSVTSDDNGGAVMRRSRKPSTIICAARPKYEAEGIDLAKLSHMDVVIKKDGKTITLDGYTGDGTSYAPIRALAEALGYKVVWTASEPNKVIIE